MAGCTAEDGAAITRLPAIATPMVSSVASVLDLLPPTDFVWRLLKDECCWIDAMTKWYFLKGAQARPSGPLYSGSKNITLIAPIRIS
ncbi:hypothetical protein AOC05_14585 [Arthrobacter alpinus]|uniref:Uncharacterized protein n=1 Tax=Arthrobacter alpinus TaxID=656366 RepID=A0A0M4QY94_9MICC|nr:hypothetical protein AOC05_14585 [Arthrobacter alpinus]